MRRRPPQRRIRGVERRKNKEADDKQSAPILPCRPSHSSTYLRKRAEGTREGRTHKCAGKNSSSVFGSGYRIPAHGPGLLDGGGRRKSKGAPRRARSRACSRRLVVSR